MIPTSRPHLPPLSEYVAYLEGIWERAWLTNNGPLLLELERAVAEFLGAAHVVIVANGTLAMQLAMRALGVRRQIICTPFSYVATASAPAWEGAEVVMADVEPAHLTLAPHAAEQAITERTDALVATHVYGIACDHDALSALAARRGLRLIYDAAHAFGARYQGRSLAALGDASVLSFHATKLFHSVEGGAVVTGDAAVAERVRSYRNFGHVTPDAFGEPGINAKCSELHAAMGLTMLPRVPRLMARRAELAALYDAALAGLPISRPAQRAGTVPNHAYYAVLLPDADTVLRAQRAFGAHDVQLRRYFHPALTALQYARGGAAPVAEAAASRVVCLPLYAELQAEQVRAIAGTLRDVLTTG